MNRLVQMPRRSPLLLLGNSDAGVAHRNLQQRPIVRSDTLDIDDHFPMFGELDRIPHQIHDDLSQSPGSPRTNEGHPGTDMPAPGLSRLRGVLVI